MLIQQINLILKRVAFSCAFVFKILRFFNNLLVLSLMLPHFLLLKITYFFEFGMKTFDLFVLCLKLLELGLILFELILQLKVEFDGLGVILRDLRLGLR